MALKNSLQKYGSIAKFFHWTVAVLIVALLILGCAVTFMDDSPIQEPLINIHKLFGLLVLTLAALRLLWLLFNPKPQMPMGMKWWETMGAKAAHGLLYVIMFAMPLSGWVMSTAAGYIPNMFGLKFPMPGIPASKPLYHQFANIHLVIAWVLVSLLVLHIGAALKHHFIAKDEVLKRMLPGASV